MGRSAPFVDGVVVELRDRESPGTPREEGAKSGVLAIVRPLHFSR